jgi:hypothetical protein
LASNRTRLASNKSSMHAIADWRSPTLAQISGRVWTAAYWREPQICRKHCRFCSSMFQNLDGFDFVLHTFFGTFQYCRPSSDGIGFHRNQLPHNETPKDYISRSLPMTHIIISVPTPYAIIDMYA